jgi:hypothetical protein
VLAQVNTDGDERFQVELLHIAGRGLKHHLKLSVFEEPVRILAVTAVGGPAGWLGIGDGEGTRVKHAQKGLRRHGAGANLHVIRLLQYASTLGPKGLQTKEEFLKGKNAGYLQSHGWILNQTPACLRGARSARAFPFLVLEKTHLLALVCAA